VASMFATFSYAFKRVFRSWKLFSSLLLGATLAAAFFAGVNMGTDTIAIQSLNQQLTQIYSDMVISAPKTTILSSANITSLISLVSTVNGVKDVSTISRGPGRVKFSNGNFTFIGISNNSHIYNNLILESGSPRLGINEIYIDTDSEDAEKLNLGDNITLTITIPSGKPGKTLSINLTLTVVGRVRLTDQGFLMAAGRYAVSIFSPLLTGGLKRPSYNLLILSWENTLSKVLDEIYSLSPPQTPVTTDLLLSLDRGTLVNPWDVSGSKENLDLVTAQVQNKLSLKVKPSAVSTVNYLAIVLNAYQTLASLMTLQGVILSLPVFFVAWYVGLTVAYVSFNLRRREIGLLLTKGFTKNQLLRIFLSEAALVGGIAAAAGLGLGLLFTPPFVLGQWGSFPAVEWETVLLVTVFSIIIALLAVFQPARRAANLNVVDTLREYFYVEEVKPYKRLWPWIAFLLGSYKIVMLLLGLNLSTLLPTIGGRGFLLSILIVIARFLDGVLTYIGPILFFWGVTKILMRGSLKFQEVLGRLTGFFMKDLNLLVERNVKRNATRVASTAFLLALIMGYSLSVIGAVASEQDYALRTIYANVGADMSVSLSSANNVTSVKEVIGNLSGVLSVASEYSFSGQSSLGSIQLRAVNPERWLSTAYYEEEWFSGSSAQTALSTLASESETIILERIAAQNLNLKVDDLVSLTFGQAKAFNLKVAGFFGPETSEEVNLPGAYWSYVPEDIYSQVKSTVVATARILVKLAPEANEEEIATQIQNLNPDVERVDSVSEQLKVYQSNVLITGRVNLQRLGVFFAALAASIGSGLVILATLEERRKEMTLLLVRGLSIKQLASTLLTENLGVLLFAGVLGSAVGYLIVRGNVAASNALVALVMRRVVFPWDALSSLLTIVALLLLSVLIPVVIMVKRSASKLVLRT